jgi:hypothetical protein
MLYQFQQLGEKLTEWGFPPIHFESDYEVIPPTDFSIAYMAGEIKFRPDGIYLTHNGKECKVYMYLTKSYISRFGNHPKFHLTKCRTIQEFIDNNEFEENYSLANSNIVDLVDDTTGIEYNDITLRFCENCRKKIRTWISTTDDFFNSLDRPEIRTMPTIETDIFGYTKDWQFISKEYRRSIDYTCESCGIKSVNNFDNRYWHVHHKDGNKMNNQKTNLECLCILCHSYQDIRHKENFDKERMKKKLDVFATQYRNELKKINNQYLNIYQHERK